MMNHPSSRRLFVRPIAIVIAFVLMLIAGDRLIGAALGRAILASEFRYSRLYRGGLDMSIVVFGNSRALNIIDAPVASRTLDQPVFNAAFPGLDTTSVAPLIEDYLRLNDPPDVIILEITGLTVEPGTAYDMFAMYFGPSPAMRGLLRRYKPRRAFGCSVSRVFRANGPMVHRSLMYFGRDDQDWITPAERVIPPELLDRPLADTPLAIAPDNLDALRRIVKACDKAGTRLVPMLAPYAPGVLGDRNLAEDYSSIVKAAVPGCPSIVDYSRAIDRIDAFADRVHTNSRGAELLLERMKTDGILTPSDQ